MKTDIHPNCDGRPVRLLLLRLEAHLTAAIRGQDAALVRMASVLRRGELGLSSPHRPKGSLLLLGPTGVGKTESTVVFTRYLMGEGRLFRFDMSEYQTQESLGLLLGSRADERGNLGRCVETASTGTLLFDEIEKAHPRVMDVFLQILDAARITFADGTDLPPKKRTGVKCSFGAGATKPATRNEHETKPI